MPDLNSDLPDHARVSLTGHCACCGAPTRSLFAMGHDARFRGFLQRALASGDWASTVSWFTSPTESTPVAVDLALARVAALIGRDWTEKVTSGASRLARRPVSALPPSARPTVAPTPAPARAFTPDASRTAKRIDDLIDRLARTPMVGQWGWYRPEADPSTRYAARVQHTRRDSEQSSLIDLFVPDLGRIVERVAPTTWLKDESLRAEAL